MSSLDEKYWTERYEEAQIGWDLGAISPPLKAYIDGLDTKSLRILLPGAGNAYEWRYLIDHGFVASEVVDLSDTPLQALRKLYPAHSSNLHHLDFFHLKGTYDLIIEQTFFCALAPDQRPSYVKKMHGLLADDGLLVGLLFDRKFDAPGPPFGGSRQEYVSVFSEQFEVLKMEPCYNSVPPRLGHELFFILRKKRSVE